jgi:hypothetical protein
MRTDAVVLSNFFAHPRRDEMARVPALVIQVQTARMSDHIWEIHRPDESFDSTSVNVYVRFWIFDV